MTTLNFLPIVSFGTPILFIGVNDSFHTCAETCISIASSKVPKFQIYQNSLTPEISYNFKAMEKILPAEKSEIEINKLLIPANTNKKCLVLDLDETLIHVVRPLLDYSVMENNLLEPEIIIPEYDLCIIVRPFAHEFLKTLSTMFQIVVFSIIIESNRCLQRVSENMLKKL